MLTTTIAILAIAAGAIALYFVMPMLPKLIDSPPFVGWPTPLETIGWWLFVDHWDLIFLLIISIFIWRNSQPLIHQETILSYGWAIGAGFTIWSCFCFLKGHGMAVG